MRLHQVSQDIQPRHICAENQQVISFESAVHGQYLFGLRKFVHVLIVVRIGLARTVSTGHSTQKPPHVQPRRGEVVGIHTP